MGRLFESLSYALIAVAMVGAILYRLARSTESGGASTTSNIAQSAPSPSVAHTPVHAPAPTLVFARPAPAENVVRTKDKTYYLPTVSQPQSDIDTYNDLRRVCYEAANNNRNGEFPAMQQSACGRFWEFAQRRGWDTGSLPAYGTPPPQQQIAYEGEAAPPGASPSCGALKEEQESIEAEMRAGYHEPRGNWLRARLRQVDDEIWSLRCPTR